MKKYNYILLDWDGCLAKTLDIWLIAYKQTFAEYDLYPSDETITKEVFGDWKGPIKVGIRNIDEYTQKLLAKVDRRYSKAPLYENVASTIFELKTRRKKLALISTSKKAMIVEALENCKLSTSFDVILAAEDVTNHKPDPEIINRVLEGLGGNKAETVIIGDSKSDLGAAKNAGIDSILYYSKHNEKFYSISDLKSYQPTYIINDFSKALEIIN